MKLVDADGGPGWDYGYRLRPAARPKALDFDDGEEPFLAAYSLEGGRLTLAFPGAGKGRPKKLAVGQGCDLLVVFRRVKAR
jgi:uncharacterized protein (TIGR03067 family)